MQESLEKHKRKVEKEVAKATKILKEENNAMIAALKISYQEEIKEIIAKESDHASKLKREYEKQIQDLKH